jgi:hypothetical protein
MGACQLRPEVKQLGRLKRKHGRKKSSLPTPKEIEVGGKKGKERKENYPSPLQKRELGEKREKEKLFTCCKGERSWKENN